MLEHTIEITAYLSSEDLVRITGRAPYDSKNVKDTWFLWCEHCGFFAGFGHDPRRNFQIIQTYCSIAETHMKWIKMETDYYSMAGLPHGDNRGIELHGHLWTGFLNQKLNDYLTHGSKNDALYYLKR